MTQPDRIPHIAFEFWRQLWTYDLVLPLGLFNLGVAFSISGDGKVFVLSPCSNVNQSKPIRIEGHRQHKVNVPVGESNRIEKR